MTRTLLRRQTTVSDRNSDITGVILVGGKSRRMGQDKAFLPVGGRPLVARLVACLSGCFERLLLVGDQGERFHSYGLPVLPDLYPGSSLGGLYTGLYHAETSHIFVSSCDLPFPNAELVQLICSQKKGYDAVIPTTRGGMEPLFALYGKSSLPAMHAALDAGNYRITELLAGLHVNYLVPDLVDKVDRDGKALINLNTPQEYQQCIRSTI
ncbi:MAG: molybdenum cofactor guanylyltransferase [Desulfuromonadaceae bacterium]|nr:molybdenum cofactor guanylyltransferase [Desulfuromonadaceae bacterium]